MVNVVTNLGTLSVVQQERQPFY